MLAVDKFFIIATVSIQNPMKIMNCIYYKDFDAHQSFTETEYGLVPLYFRLNGFTKFKILKIFGKHLQKIFELSILFMNMF